MAVKAINEPIYEWTCDLCETKNTGRWIPENWASLNVSIVGDNTTGQLLVCQECITTSSIVILLNKIKTNIGEG